MPGAGDRERASELDWEDLDRLWEGIKSEFTPEESKGEALERLVLCAFDLGGAVVRWPYKVGLWGKSTVAEEIDGAVHCLGLHCLIECKNWRKNVDFEPVAKLRSQLLRRPAGTVGIVFSAGGFTTAAIELARFAAHEGIMLWNGDEIEYALRKRDFVDALMVKYRGCVECAYPSYSLIAEETP